MLRKPHIGAERSGVSNTSKVQNIDDLIFFRQQVGDFLPSDFLFGCKIIRREPRYGMGATSKAAIIVLVLLGFVESMNAATLRVLSDEAQTFTIPSRCNFRLDGEILAGDLAKVAAARAQVQRLISERLAANWSMAAQFASHSPVLCLNSRGGNFSEGLRIAMHLMNGSGADHAVTTYVEDRGECYSACALIFLAGSLFGRGGESYPARFLHVGGRLGFHAPYIDPGTLEDRSYSRTEMAETFEAAIGGVTAAIQLFDRRTFGGPKVHDDNRPWVSSSLFIEMLRKGPNELFAIDTVGKAGRWGIGLVGAKEVNVLNVNVFRQACDNVSAWENDAEVFANPGYEAVSSSDGDFKYFTRLEHVTLFRIRGMRRTYFCLVRPLFSPQRRPEGLIVRLLRDIRSIEPGTMTFFGYEVPLWAAAFPSNAPLLSLRP